MALTVDKQQTAEGDTVYIARCLEKQYHFEITGRGSSAADAERDFLKKIDELRSRLDEVAQISKVSA
ncbi:hypothetical protein [[Erwinia] mediterraneensis]|uniref:hypothetical protein n=1 Tax=[Erwinia] mediterraneensis TaxID=2161819 RepID=UPI00103026AB|nr:hypothetical protein [[Erwinia] mediterraneensis]